MRRARKFVASAAILLLWSTMPSAASAAPSRQPAAGDAWLTLSMLTTSGAASLDGAAVAQPDTPPPPPPNQYQGFSGIPWPVIAVWLAVIAVDIYILTKDHHHHANSPG